MIKGRCTSAMSQSSNQQAKHRNEHQQGVTNLLKRKTDIESSKKMLSECDKRSRGEEFGAKEIILPEI